MKSLNIKIPLSIASAMDDNGHLNPQFISEFLYHFKDSKLNYNLVKELSYTYTFKVTSDLHKELKYKSFKDDMPINQIVCAMFNEYYRVAYNV